MNGRKNTALWIGVGVAVVGVALLLFLPKKAQSQNTFPNPFGGDDFGGNGSGQSSGNGSGGGEIGCGGGYTKQGFPLRRNSCGSEVAKLQAYLNNSGSYGLVVDGKFGRLTENAVKDEQSPFAEFKSMYPNAIQGQVTQEFYNDFIA